MRDTSEYYERRIEQSNNLYTVNDIVIIAMFVRTEHMRRSTSNIVSRNARLTQENKRRI
jgi:hypothetical protein